MNKTLLQVLIINLILFSTGSFAQMTRDEYDLEKKSLTEKRLLITKEIKKSKSEIDSLRNNLSELDQVLNKCYSELFTKKYGEEIGWRVLNKRIWIGMTDEMVRDGWGSPDRENKNTEPWGVFIQLYYGDIIFFFRDGKLTDWQEGPEE